jgi:hypothetical protein
VYHTVVLLEDGTIRAWGYNGDGQCDIPPVCQIAASSYATLAILENGSVRVWGRYTNGQCDIPPDLLPVRRKPFSSSSTNYVLK